MKTLILDILALAGVGIVLAGVAMIYIPAAIITGGLAVAGAAIKIGKQLAGRG